MAPSPELVALEALAVSLFESFMRQQATEGRGRSIQDWCDIPKDSRIHWRNKAAEMVEELLELGDPERQKWLEARRAEARGDA